MSDGSNQIIDADIHPWINGDIEGLKPYLSRGWYEHFEGRYRLPDHPLRPPLAKATSVRLDAVPPSGGVGGSDPQFVVHDLLDPYHIEHAVLCSIQAGKLVTLPNAGEALVLARAFNDYFIDQWLSVDSRYKLAMVVGVHDPREAAKEIRRIGRHEQVAAVYMPLFNILMGNRYYDPIYEAAEEAGLPLLIHPTGTEGGFALSVALTGGTPSTYIERHTNFPQIAMSQIVSLIFEGVFIRFPKLRLLASEFGYSWVPGLMWRMDQNWRNFRREVPWLTEPPSEYLLRHVRFTTQPVEEPPTHQSLFQIIEMMHGDRMLLFSTDYPHWDNDYPHTVPFRKLDGVTQRRIYYENAAEFFGFRPARADGGPAD